MRTHTALVASFSRRHVEGGGVGYMVPSTILFCACSFSLLHLTPIKLSDFKQ